MHILLYLPRKVIYPLFNKIELSPTGSGLGQSAVSARTAIELVHFLFCAREEQAIFLVSHHDTNFSLIFTAFGFDLYTLLHTSAHLAIGLTCRKFLRSFSF